MSRFFVVSAPSGTGKTTLNNRLVAQHPNVVMSVSITSRPKRVGEEEGKAYYFVNREAFLKHIDQGDMLEWAEVFGNLYGTRLREVQRILGAGKSALLEIDVQGWQSVSKKVKDGVSIFILPPTLKDLWQRLEKRGSDSLEIRLKRLVAAQAEIAAGHFYEHFIINHDFDTAYEELRRIIIDGKHSSLSRDAGIQHCQKLLEEYDSASWLRDLRQQQEKQHR